MNLVGKTMRASKNLGRFVATARINTGTTCQDHEDDDGVDDALLLGAIVLIGMKYEL